MKVLFRKESQQDEKKKKNGKKIGSLYSLLGEIVVWWAQIWERAGVDGFHGVRASMIRIPTEKRISL